MFRFFIKGLGLALVLTTIVVLGARREPALRAQAEAQLVAAWLTQQPAMIEDGAKWSFKGISFNQHYVRLEPIPNRDIILGSSHQMFIRQALLGGKQPFFNHWITGINHGMDVLPPVYQAYKNNDILPRKVILGIDPWLLQKPTSPTNNIWGQLTLWKTQMMTDFVLRFQQSLTYVLPYEARLTKPLVIQSIMNDDGSFICASNLITCVWPNLADQERLVQKNSNKVDAIFASPIDAELQAQFERFVLAMLADHVQVAFVETPFHPLVKPAVMQNSNAAQTDRYFRDFAARYQIPFVGSFNPDDCKLDANDFVDVDHLNETGTAKLLTQPYCKFGPWEQFLKP